jgi:ribose transport system permease protein
LFFYLEQPHNFFSLQNIQNLVNTLPILGMLAIGVTVVLVLGEFDLSITNVAELCVLVVSILMTKSLGSGAGIALAFLICLGTGVLFGSVNGLAVGYGKASAFIVTLAVGSIAAGIELLLQTKIGLGQTTIPQLSLPTALLDLTNVHVLGFQLAVPVFLAIAILLALILVHTPWGRHVQAIGGNETAARLAGVPVRRAKVIAFAVTGLMAGVTGILFASTNGYYSAATPGFLLPAYAAAFFGAAAIGRRGFSVPSTVFGVLYLTTLSNGLSVMDEPTWVVSVVQGAVLFVTVLMARAGSRT